jgi:hypothetical protein
MFTETELKRIKSFLKQYRNLNKVAQNLRSRLWYRTHGTMSPTKEAQIEGRSRKVANAQRKVYNKSVEYANILKRKYGLRIPTIGRPNLREVGWARRRNVNRRTAEKTMRTANLVPNTIRHSVRMAYPSPPRKRTLIYPPGFASGRHLQTPRIVYHEPW